jgi:hypothetical protein
MANIKFFRGDDAGYKRLWENNRKSVEDALYFAQDTNTIYLNNVAYSGKGLPADIKAVVTQVSINTKGELVVRYSDGRDPLVFPIKYISQYKDSMTVPNKVGGIEAGTTVASLKTKSLSEIIDDLLFPTVDPTKKVDPFVIFNFSDSDHNSELHATVELGKAVLGVSQASLNKGKWTTDEDYAGNIESYKYIFNINGNEVVNSESDSAKVPGISETFYTKPVKNTYTATIQYASTSVKNNKGVVIPGSGGSATKTLTVDVGVNWYASDDVNKQSLISHGLASLTSKVTETVTLEPHSSTVTGYKQSIKIPVKSGITPKIESYDPSNGVWGDETRNWSKEEVIETVNNIEVTYAQYTFKDSNRGATQVRITF